MKKEIKLNKERLIKRSSTFGMGGVNIYKISKTETIPATIIEGCEQYPDGDEFHKKHFMVWLMSLPITCEC
jgi:hypothetical protein